MENSTEKELDFGFAFDDIDFSDRVLRLEIVPDLASNTNSSLVDANGSEFVNGSKFVTLHISCILLAANSPFFYKLFKNGMRESQKKDDVTVKIHPSEEAAFMDMLKYIYDKPLNATSWAELIDVLVVADKFEVTACMIHCAELLLKLTMTVESAVYYLELPSSVLVGEVTRPLIDAAKRHLSSHFNAFSESLQDELMRLPLCAVEAVLRSADIQVYSEEAVLDFILKWARLHYPKVEERRNILNKHLVRFVCLRCTSYLKLMEVVKYPDFDYEQVSRLVLKALSFKIELLNGSKNSAPANCDIPRHIYSRRRGIHLDIMKQDCAGMRPQTPWIYAEPFCIGGCSFSLYAKRYTGNSSDHLGLYLERKPPVSGSISLDVEFAVMKNPSKKFQPIVTTRYTFKNSDNLLARGMFSWANLFSDNSLYFIDEILHLRAQLSVIN